MLKRLFVLAALIVCAAGFLVLVPDGSPAPIPAQVADQAETFREVDWVELIPEADLQALMSPPDWLLEITDGSEEDDLSLLSPEDFADEQEARFFRALESSVIVPEMDNVRIRIPGFIVPLVFDEQQHVVEFFLVPYFGACLHLPPPPPNQIIFVAYEPGVAVESIYEPFWVEGLLTTSLISNDVADAAYQLDASAVSAYWEADTR
ncbi:DUF3299 domain-containing protein [Pseudohongiella spirulinae]|uniref:Lipoprotein n=1 Tax=Pseudohongiella spirulinae TaxID=1249552 RepID=A0A0S2KAQ0_9GAMM|nr:DUF3299 domain-containing protein [Pseudohongiella spirulinae]ALO45399.1 hypothetical protein PS2015_721 [Pseudohongiella spirulinae]